MVEPPIAPADAVVVVTGGAAGTGREIARALARRGHAVVVVCLRDQRRAEAAVEEIQAEHGTALAVRADLTDELDVERLFEEAEAAFGRVDVVVHAATHGTAVVARQAARQLRAGGAIIDLSNPTTSAPDLAHEVPAPAPPGAFPDVAELVALVERRCPGA